MGTQTPLHIAAQEGDLTKVKQLLAQNADIHALNETRQIPLSVAMIISPACADEVRSQKIAIFRLLWKRDPQTLCHQDHVGETVFHLLASQGHHELLKEVLDECPEGAKIPNHYTQYPIHQAILNGRSKCVDYLLEIPEVAALADSSMRLPLHYAASVGIGCLEIMKACCKATQAANVSLNVEDIDAKTAYDIAEEVKNTDAMDVLREYGIYHGM